MPNRRSLPRLYAILDVDLTVAKGFEPVALVEIWLAAGVRLIQLRAKTMAGGAMLDLAREMGERASAAGAVFLINDRADVARLSNADGVHVGQDDLAPRDVRRIIGDRAWLGVSTHSPAQAAVAGREPVDYVAVGPVFASGTKTGSADEPFGLAGVRQGVVAATGERDVPVVAIGGITLALAPGVIDAGASSVAVITDLLLGDPAERCRAYLEVLG